MSSYSLHVPARLYTRFIMDGDQFDDTHNRPYISDLHDRSVTVINDVLPTTELPSSENNNTEIESIDIRVSERTLSGRSHQCEVSRLAYIMIHA